MSGLAFGTALKAALAAHAPLTALVGTRIHPIEAPQNVADDAAPFLVYRRQSAEDPGVGVGGNSNLDEVGVELEAYAPTLRQAWLVADAARAAMEAWGATWDFDDEDRDPETQLYVVTANYTAWRNH